MEGLTIKPRTKPKSHFEADRGQPYSATVTMGIGLTSIGVDLQGPSTRSRRKKSLAPVTLGLNSYPPQLNIDNIAFL